MHKILKICLWIFGVLFIIYVGLVALGFWDLSSKQKTTETVNAINNRYIDLADVMGNNLPPTPDQKVNDSTVAGIDANNNGIRDDVELAIFKEYPNSAKIRAGELQYAQALQSELTSVFDSPTLIAVVKKEDSAYFCMSSSNIKGSDIADEQQEEIKAKILNTVDRKNKESSDYSKYMAGYMSPSYQGSCDVNTSSLPN